MPAPAAPEPSAAPSPAEIPVFPLTGVLLLPGSWLPLQVFEPRYLHLVEDAMAGDRHLGLIQPFAPADDNSPDPEAPPPPDPELYPVGCAGRIERCEPLPGGRLMILVRGVRRFRVRRELPPRRGYRRVEAEYEEYSVDLEEPEVDAAPVLAAIEAIGRRRGGDVDLEELATLSGRALVDGLAVTLPFVPAEKQALLEAASPEARRDLLLSLLEMGLAGGFDDGSAN